MEDEDTICIYTSSVTSCTKMRKRQERIKFLFEGKKIKVKYIDIAVDENDKKAMREKCGNNTAIPPQIFRGDTYLGDYEALDDAIEGGALAEFLGITID